MSDLDYLRRIARRLDALHETLLPFIEQRGYGLGDEALNDEREWLDCYIDQLGKETKMHPEIEHVLKFFAYEHLPVRLQEISKPFGDLAKQTAERAPDSPETTVALRKLLEAKDAAVRAVL